MTEAEVVEHAEYLAENMLSSGWEYVVVDIQWYEPTASSAAYHPFVPLAMDEFSRLIPAVNRFPSAAGGAGFGPLAHKVHELGLKFGIHVMRGIPRQAVHQNTPLLDTSVHARTIAQTNSTCLWNTDMYGINPHAVGAQEYYDSVFALYASWGVDFVKVDDILMPYADGEIELIARAIDRCGRDIVLSLSCGPLDLKHAVHVQTHADMWRMTGDFWDTWEDLSTMFDFCHSWSGYVGDGHWPDADMLPVGELALRSNEHGVGRRWSRLSRDEQVTMMTLWCIFRSPLMVGTYLPSLDPWTLDLLTNAEVLEMHRESANGRQLLRRGGLVVWLAERSETTSYLAFFNTGVTAIHAAIQLVEAGLPDSVNLRDLWSHEDLGPVTRSVAVEIPSHGARLLRVSHPSRTE